MLSTRKSLCLLVLVVIALSVVFLAIYTINNSPQNNNIQASPSSQSPLSSPITRQDNTPNNNIVTPPSNFLTAPGIQSNIAGSQSSQASSTSGNDSATYVTNGYITTVQIAATSASNPNMIQVTATVSSITGNALPDKISVHFYFYSQTNQLIEQVVSIKTGGQSSATTTFLIPILGGATSYVVDSFVYGSHHLLIGDPRGMLNW